MLTSYVRRGLGGVFVALAIAACGGGDSPTDDDDDDCPGAPGCPDNGGDPVVTTQVAVRDNNSFNPPDIRVSPGATVTWTWEGTTDEDHNITFSDSRITDGPNQRTGTHQAVFAQAGTYSYTCTNHTGMEGSVLVQ